MSDIDRVQGASKRELRARGLNQAGMVSMMVTLIMMLVITLIVIGFSQVSRRNSREALDRQLSSQAYYAAESGINDALTAIKANKITAADLNNNPSYATKCAGGGSITDKLKNLAVTTTQSDGTTSSGINSTINDSSNASYSCVLVNNKPTSLPIHVNDSTSQVLPLNLPVALGTLNFSWHSSGGGTVAGCPTAASTNNFKPADDWNASGAGCAYGLLRVDLVDLNGNPNIDATLANKTVSLFIVPTSQGSAYTPTTVAFGSGSCATVTPTCGQQSYIVRASCTDSQCTASIKPTTASQTYSARLNGVYKDLGTVTLTATGTDGSPETFQNAQLVIDATGKSQDELRRVQVRVRLTGNGNGDAIPTFAVQGTNGLCKRFTTLRQPTSRANDAANDNTIPADTCSP